MLLLPWLLLSQFTALWMLVCLQRQPTVNLASSIIAAVYVHPSDVVHITCSIRVTVRLSRMVDKIAQTELCLSPLNYNGSRSPKRCYASIWCACLPCCLFWTRHGSVRAHCETLPLTHSAAAARRRGTKDYTTQFNDNEIKKRQKEFDNGVETLPTAYPLAITLLLSTIRI